MFDFLIYIGRFEPPHKGHLAVIRSALQQTKKLLIFIGSHEVCRSLRNPFTTEERIDMLKISLSAEELKKIVFIPIHDSNYNYPEWVKEVKEKVKTECKSACRGTRRTIGIIGHKKDNTSYYLDLFPEWQFAEMPLLEDGVSSTEIRKKWFGESLTEHDKIPAAVYSYLKNKEGGQWFKDLKREFKLVNDYKDSWACSPYPPVFVAGDSCVICSLSNSRSATVKPQNVSGDSKKFILLIKRAAFPGKGLLSLPGGFLEQNESIKHCAIRELLEETGIKFSYKELENSIADCKVFDDPKREPRGRMISHCFLFNLKVKNTRGGQNGKNGLPKLKGADDASSALWFPLNDLDKIRSQIAGDHYKMIKSLVKS